MVFLHPEFLWGLLAMAIPVIIHLFDFRKNKKVYFPDISFLKQVKHSSKKPLRLKQMLILLSRLGFVFFFIMIFAQPLVPTHGQKLLKGGVKLIYIDNSQSMSSLVTTNETALELTKTIAQQIIKELPKGQEALVLTSDNASRFIAADLPNESSQKISSITLSDKAFSLNRLVMAISNYTQKVAALSDVFVISDFQKSLTSIKLPKADTTLSFWLSPIKIKSTNNCVVDSVYLKSSTLSTNTNTQIEVIISNKSAEQKKNLPVKVFVGNRQVSAATITIGSFGQKHISFSLGNISQFESGYIQLDDYPNTFDNDFYFSIPAPQVLHIFEIVGDHPSGYIKLVFGNTHLFSLFSNNYQNIDSELFEKANFVILNQIENPSLELVEQIKKFTFDGGGVLVIPSPSPAIAAYTPFTKKIVPSTSNQKQQIQAPASSSPFFAPILLNSTRNFKMPIITPAWSWGQDRSAILSLEDGSPYLSEVASHLYFLRSPLIDSLSNFQTHALFVPVMYRLATQLVAPAGQLFHRIEDEFYDVKLDSVEWKDIVKLKKDNIEIVPGKRKVGNVWRLTFPKNITTTGTYKISVGNKIKGNLSINLNPEESELTLLSNQEIAQLFLPFNVNFLDTYNPNQNILSSFDAGFALWKYALAICLLFLLVETLLIRFL